MTTPNEQSSRELLPCPFCGGEGDFCSTGVVWVRCQACGADGQHGPNQAAAIAKWNRRSALATPDQGDERRAMTAAYLAFCADKAPDHNEVGFPYFKAAWQARAYQPVAQPVVDQEPASMSDNGSCGSQVSGKPVTQEAPLLQDENAGREGRRYNEWHASRPDARLNAREAAAALAAPQPSQGAFTKEELEVLASAVGALNFTKYRCLFDKVEALRLATPHPPVSAEAGKGEPFGYWHEGPSEDESEFFLAKDLPSNDCPRCFPLYLAPSESVAVSAAPSALPAQAVGEKADGDFARMAESAGAKMRWGDHGLPPEFPSWGSWGRFCDSVRSLAAPVPQPEPASKAEVSVQEAENIIAALLRDTKDYGKPALVAKQWAEDFMRKRALASPTQQREPQEAAECPHVNEPCGCYRVRCQLGRKCVGDDL